MDQLTQEKEKLREILKHYDKELEKEQWNLNHIKDLFGNDDWLVDEQKEYFKNRIRHLKENEKIPYFARIDFAPNGEEKTSFYLGKIGILDQDKKAVITDWRSPVASLYYENGLGEQSYRSQEGKIKGILSLKRQYQIEEKQLLSYRDVDLVSNDELLQPYLDKNNNDRLKNIVATIQKSQNEIIRKNPYKNLIIQGVAGSGKTTVALHRIAYLIYNYRDQILSKDYLIFGPNPYFLQYISEVLPDLDVYDVKQTDFESFAEKYLKRKITKTDKTMEFKKSMTYYHNLTTFLKKQEETLFQEDFCFEGHILLSKKTLKKWYQESRSPFRIEKIKKVEYLLKNYLKNHLDDLWISFENQEDPTYYFESKRKFLKEKTKIITNYFQKYKRNYFFVYKEFLKNQNLPPTITKEDYTALLYLKNTFHEDFNYQHYKQIILDEAQDYSLFQFLVLKKIFKFAKFNLYGDLAQSIISIEAIHTWEETFPIFENPEFLLLNKSYRTTIEIMEQANKINEYLNLPKASMVLRHGSKVEYIKNIETMIDLIKKQNGKSIAFLVKEPSIFESLHPKIKKILRSFQENKERKFSIFDVSLAKGLEFDLVFLLDVGYHLTEKDLKLYYVAMTRALQKLYILYREKPLLSCF